MKPPEPVFFVDRALGNNLVPTSLRSAGYKVEILEDHFVSNERDEVWLKAVGERGWLVLTKDRAIRRRANELAAVAAANVKLFALTGGSISGEQMAQILVKAAPKMARVALGNRPPFVATVTSGGKVKVVLKSRKLRRYFG